MLVHVIVFCHKTSVNSHLFSLTTLFKEEESVEVNHGGKSEIPNELQ